MQKTRASSSSSSHFLSVLYILLFIKVSLASAEMERKEEEKADRDESSPSGLDVEGGNEERTEEGGTPIRGEQTAGFHSSTELGTKRKDLENDDLQAAMSSRHPSSYLLHQALGGKQGKWKRRRSGMGTATVTVTAKKKALAKYARRKMRAALLAEAALLRREMRRERKRQKKRKKKERKKYYSQSLLDDALLNSLMEEEAFLNSIDESAYAKPARPPPLIQLRMPPARIQAPFADLRHLRRRQFSKLAVAPPRSVLFHPREAATHYGERGHQALNLFEPSPRDPYATRQQPPRPRDGEEEYYYYGHLKSPRSKPEVLRDHLDIVEPDEIVDHYRRVFRHQISEEERGDEEEEEELKPDGAILETGDLREQRRPAQPPDWDFLHTNVQDYFYRRPLHQHQHHNDEGEKARTIQPYLAHLRQKQVSPYYDDPSYYYRSNVIQEDSPSYDDDDNDDPFPKLFEHNHHPRHRHHHHHHDHGTEGDPLDLAPFAEEDPRLHHRHRHRHRHRHLHQDPNVHVGGGIHRPDFSDHGFPAPGHDERRCHRHLHRHRGGVSHRHLFPPLEAAAGDYDDGDDGFTPFVPLEGKRKSDGGGGEVDGGDGGEEEKSRAVDRYKKYGSSLSLRPINKYKVTAYKKGDALNGVEYGYEVGIHHDNGGGGAGGPTVVSYQKMKGFDRTGSLLGGGGGEKV